MAKGDRVVTVRGEISPHDLGITLTHEHLLIDSSFYLDFYPLPKEKWKRNLLEQPLKLENLWFARRQLFSFRDNMVVDNENMVTDELESFKRSGGRSLTDLTPHGLHGDPVAARRISENSGVNVISGCGFYVEATHPKYVLGKSAEELSKELTSLVEDGYGDTGIRAGLIGEVGTGPTVTKQEEKVLTAAALAQKKTGAPISVHLANIKGRNGPYVAKLMKEQGADMGKVVLCHLDMKYQDFGHQREIADFGTFLGMDSFGEEDYVENLDYLPPRDKERVANIVALIDKGHLGQLLPSHDTCRKMQYKKYGGQGFDHLLRNVVPLMESAGITNKEIRTMFVKNPARLLAF